MEPSVSVGGGCGTDGSALGRTSRILQGCRDRGRQLDHERSRPRSRRHRAARRPSPGGVVDVVGPMRRILDAASVPSATLDGEGQIVGLNPEVRPVCAGHPARSSGCTCSPSAPGASGRGALPARAGRRGLSETEREELRSREPTEGSARCRSPSVGWPDPTAGSSGSSPSRRTSPRRGGQPGAGDARSSPGPPARLPTSRPDFPTSVRCPSWSALRCAARRPTTHLRPASLPRHQPGRDRTDPRSRSSPGNAMSAFGTTHPAGSGQRRHRHPLPPRCVHRDRRGTSATHRICRVSPTDSGLGGGGLGGRRPCRRVRHGHRHLGRRRRRRPRSTHRRRDPSRRGCPPTASELPHDRHPDLLVQLSPPPELRHPVPAHLMVACSWE